MNDKEETKKAYNTYPEKFNKKFEVYFHNFVKKEADLFLKHLQGKTILDIGAGPGIHAIYFKEQGYDPFCIDISEAMIELCKKRRLKAEVKDIEQLEMHDVFDGIWAYTVLLHIPKKRIPPIIKKIASLLKPQGIFGLAIKEGQGEGFEKNEDYPQTRRWFTYFTEKEIQVMYKNEFELMHVSKTPIKNQIFVNYLLRKKA